MPTLSISAEVQHLVTLLDEAFDKKAWHGPNLKGALRGVTPAQALWRPASGRHNIWELALHTAYWKYTVRRRITGEKRGSFAFAGSNWFACPESPDESAWKKLAALLNTEHRALRETVLALERPEPGVLRQIRGAACHDLYHAGQIQLLKRILPAT